MKRYKIEVVIECSYEINIDAQDKDDAEDIFFEEFDPSDVETLGELIGYGDINIVSIEEVGPPDES